jgi:predicted metal-dependent hydrolase
MRLYIAAIVLVWSSNLELNAQDSKIHWMSVEEVTEALKEDPRPIMMDVYTAWVWTVQDDDGKYIYESELDRIRK